MATTKEARDLLGQLSAHCTKVSESASLMCRSLAGDTRKTGSVDDAKDALDKDIIGLLEKLKQYYAA